MTVDEVRAAAKGAAVNVDDSGENTEDAIALLRSPYDSGPLRFNAYFLFARDTQRLVRVDLEPTGASDGRSRSLQAAELYGTLTARYGEPESCDRSDLLEACRWRDAPRGNLVYYTRIGFRDTTSVSVSYRQLVDAKAEGL